MDRGATSLGTGSILSDHSSHGCNAIAVAPRPPCGLGRQRRCALTSTSDNILRLSVESGLVLIPMHGVVPLWDEGGKLFWLCTCGNPACGNNAGKHPRAKWKDHDAALGRKPDYLRWKYGGESPDNPFNWAYHLGVSGVLGVDVDPRNGGTESWAALVEKYGPLPPTPLEHVLTRGWHAYLAAPAADLLPASTHVEVAPGVELKWGNHYFIGPPSVHRCGHSYQWITRPWETPFAETPPWLIDLAHEAA